MLKQDFLDRFQVAEYIGVGPETMRIWRRNNTGPKSYMLAGRIVYRRAEVDQWIAAQLASTVRGGAV